MMSHLQPDSRRGRLGLCFLHIERHLIWNCSSALDQSSLSYDPLLWLICFVLVSMFSCSNSLMSALYHCAFSWALDVLLFSFHLIILATSKKKKKTLFKLLHKTHWGATRGRPEATFNLKSYTHEQKKLSWLEVCDPGQRLRAALDFTGVTQISNTPVQEGFLTALFAQMAVFGFAALNL